MATENLVTGKYYRILKDKANDVWDRISFWTHSDDVQTSSGITLTNDLSAKDTKITATQNDFATIESSSVASHAYVKGNMLVYGGQLYRAKTAISVGSTLTVGSNIEAVTVGTLSNMLTATNGNQFYFDVKDGKPGFYPSASKTASQFVPFGGTTRYGSKSQSFTSNDGSGSTNIDLSSLGFSNISAIYVFGQISSQNVVAACYMWIGSEYQLLSPYYTWNGGLITSISLNTSSKVLTVSYRWNPIGTINANVICNCVGT